MAAPEGGGNPILEHDAPDRGLGRLTGRGKRAEYPSPTPLGPAYALAPEKSTQRISLSDKDLGNHWSEKGIFRTLL